MPTKYKYPNLAELAEEVVMNDGFNYCYPVALADLLLLIPEYKKAGGLYTRKKPVFRNIEFPAEMLYYIIISQLENEYPFFSCRKEYAEAYLKEKIDRKELGYSLSSKLVDELNDLEDRLEKSEKRATSFEKKAVQLDQVAKVLEDYGVELGRDWSWGRKGLDYRPEDDWEEQLISLLQNGLSEIVQEKLNAICSKADEIREIL